MTAAPALRALELTVPDTGPGEVELCARLIARYARTADDGDLLAEALGLDEPAPPWKGDAGRIHRLALGLGKLP